VNDALWILAHPELDKAPKVRAFIDSWSPRSNLTSPCCLAWRAI